MTRLAVHSTTPPTDAFAVPPLPTRPGIVPTGAAAGTAVTPLPLDAPTRGAPVRTRSTSATSMTPTWNGPAREKRALDAYVVLMRAFSSVSARLHGPLAAEHGLTMGQLGVLEALHEHGPMSQSALAGRLLVSASNLTTVLDNLERDGLVKRVRDTVDRRVSNVHLTSAGIDRITACLPGHVARIADAMAGLSAVEQKQLFQLCRKLGLTAAGLEPDAVDGEA